MTADVLVNHFVSEWEYNEFSVCSLWSLKVWLYLQGFKTLYLSLSHGLFIVKLRWSPDKLVVPLQRTTHAPRINKRCVDVSFGVGDLVGLCSCPRKSSTLWICQSAPFPTNCGRTGPYTACVRHTPSQSSQLWVSPACVSALSPTCIKMAQSPTGLTQVLFDKLYCSF